MEDGNVSNLRWTEMVRAGQLYMSAEVALAVPPASPICGLLVSGSVHRALFQTLRLWF
jgi:hypothetical protein